MAGVSDKNAFKAGLFILAALAGAVAIVWVTTGGLFGLFSGGSTRTVAFAVEDDIAGLAVGGEVRVGGRPVGQVDAVRFDDGYDRVLVDVTVPGDLPIRRGANARVQSTLTGQVSLNFQSLGDGQPLPPDEPIPGDAATINDVLDAVARLTPQLESAVADLRGQTLPRTTAALDDTGRAARQVAALAESLNLALDDGGPEDLRAALAGLRETADRLPKLADEASALVDRTSAAIDQLSADLDGTGETLTRVLEQADVAVQNATEAAVELRSTSAEVRGLIAGNRGRVNQIIERLGDTSRTLDLASSEIRRSPWRLLYRPGGEQRANLNLYDAARQFAEGANALEDAAVALQAAAGDPAADPADVEAILAELRGSFERFEAAERELYRRIQN